MADYELFGNAMLGTTNADWSPGITVGMRFMITSSTSLVGYSGSVFPFTGSVNGVQWYKRDVDTGSHTGSLWDGDGTLLGVCNFDNPTFTGSASGWISASFNPPIELILDHEYRIAVYTYRYGSYRSNYFQTNYYQTNSYYNPLIGLKTGGCYRFSGSSPAGYSGITFPVTTSNEWYVVDVMLTGSNITFPARLKPTGSQPLAASPCVNGYLQGINIGSPTDLYGGTAFGRPYITGITKSMDEGSPLPPSLCLQYPGMWRFRWYLKTGGSRTVSVRAKQNSTGSQYRPSIVIKKNISAGVNNDLSSSAADGAGWQTIGPVTVANTSAGSVWVELWNNEISQFNTPCYFDHIVTT